jgi:glutathione S-transferase
MCKGDGPNPWKNVILFEELGIPYNATYLTFGAGSGGVEHESFLKINPAGRVPWIKDPATGSCKLSQVTTAIGR